MGRGNEVEVVAPLPPQGDHHRRQLGASNLASFVALADVVILAEDAAQVAAGQKDRAAAAAAGQGALLAEVRAVAGDHRRGADPAGAALAFEAVDATVVDNFV